MLGFLESIQQTMDELYLSYVSAEGRKKGHIPNMILKRVHEIEESGYASGTAHHTIKATRSFFNANQENLIFNGSKHKVRSRGQRIIEKDEIKQLLDLTGSLQNKAIIMTLKDSGLRVSDIVKLNYRDVKDAIASERQFHIISIITKKTGTEAKPILGPEALDAISQWLKSREDKLEANSPLFIKTQGDEIGSRLTSGSIGAIMRKLCKKAKFERVSAHSLRKYHMTMLQAGGMTPEWIAIIQGRIISDSRLAYTCPSERQLIGAYQQAYPQFSVLQKGQNEEIQSLQRENEELRTRLADLENTMQQLVTAISKEKMDYFKPNIRK